MGDVFSSKMSADSPEFIPTAERQRIVCDKLEQLDQMHRHQLQSFLLRQTHEQQSLQRRLFLEHYDNLQERPLHGLELMIMEFPRQLLLLQWCEDLEEKFERSVLSLRDGRDRDLHKLRELHAKDLELKAEEHGKEMQDLIVKHREQMRQLVLTDCEEFGQELQMVQRKQCRELELKQSAEERELKSMQIGREFQLNAQFELQVRNMKARLEKELAKVPPLQPVVLLDPWRYLRMRRERREQKRLSELEEETAQPSGGEEEKPEPPPSDPPGPSDPDEAGASAPEPNPEPPKEEADDEEAERQRAQLEREKKQEREFAHARQLEEERADKRAREIARERLRLHREGEAQGSKDSPAQEMQSPPEEAAAPPPQPDDGQASGVSPQGQQKPEQAPRPTPQQPQVGGDQPEEAARQPPTRIQPFAFFNGATSTPKQQPPQAQYHSPQPQYAAQQQSPSRPPPQSPNRSPQYVFQPPAQPYHGNQQGRNPYRFVGHNYQPAPQGSQYQPWDFYPRSNIKNVYTVPYQADAPGGEGDQGYGHNSNAMNQWVATANGPQYMGGPQAGWVQRPGTFRGPNGPQQQFQQRQQPGMRQGPSQQGRGPLQQPPQQQQQQMNRPPALGDLGNGGSRASPAMRPQLGYYDNHCHQLQCHHNYHSVPPVPLTSLRRPGRGACPPPSPSSRPFSRADAERMPMSLAPSHADRRRTVLINAAKPPLPVFAPPKPVQLPVAQQEPTQASETKPPNNEPPESAIVTPIVESNENDNTPKPNTEDLKEAALNDSTQQEEMIVIIPNPVVNITNIEHESKTECHSAAETIAATEIESNKNNEDESALNSSKSDT